MTEEHKNEDRIWQDDAERLARFLNALPSLNDHGPVENWIDADIRIRRSDTAEGSIAYTVHYDYEAEQWYAIKEATK